MILFCQELECTGLNNREYRKEGEEKKDEQRSLYTNLQPVGCLGKTSPSMLILSFPLSLCPMPLQLLAIHAGGEKKLPSSGK